ncbi:MAG: hypothetical protein AAF211_16700 [Myxococcota bacterium]
MSTLTLFIAWLLSLVGLQDCDDPANNSIDCPTPASVAPSPASNHSQQPIGFISNGL